MSNPARAPTEPTANQLLLAVAPDSYLPEGFGDSARRYKRVEEHRAALAVLDMDMAASIILPKQLCIDQSVRKTSGPALAKAKVGVPVARVRTGIAKKLVNEAFRELSATDREFSSTEVALAMGSKVFVDAGTEATVGRLVAAYPRRGVAGLVAITAAEAREAVRAAGINVAALSAGERRPYPLTASTEVEGGLRVNPNSDNGFPVLGKWNFDGAALMAMGIAQTVRNELEAAQSIAEWKREAEAGRPWLVAVRGKAKADFYSQEKVAEARMRFYNVFPRQIVLNMQVATQVVDAASKSLLDDPESRTAIGTTLVRGGADRLVQELQGRLDRDGYAFVHVGDDSWVIGRDGDWGDVVMFALDCSNFDLTQHADVTREVHRAIAAELRSIDRVASELWHAYARDRLVVTVGATAYQWKHGGPSGMPLQSKVNDALMDVLIRRALARLGSGRSKDWSERAVSDAVATAGREMGFSVKLEQYRKEGLTLRESLCLRPFLFVGYYFYAETKHSPVLVVADVARTFAQAVFPTQKWTSSPVELKIKEAFRLASIALNLGIAPRWRSVRGALEQFRISAMQLLTEAINVDQGATPGSRLRWTVEENPFGAQVVPSLLGLLEALRRDDLWEWRPPVSLPPAEFVTEFLARATITQGQSWADAVEEEAVGGERPAAMRVRPRALPPARVPTHEVSSVNHGRMPPVAVWGPNQVRRRDQAAGPSGRRTRRQQWGGEEASLDSDSYASSSEEDWWSRYEEDVE